MVKRSSHRQVVLDEDDEENYNNNLDDEKMEVLLIPQSNSTTFASSDATQMYKKSRISSNSENKKQIPDTKTLLETFQKIKKTLECPICTEALQRPFTTHCGHTYCYECLLNWLKESKSCPTCRQKLYTQPSPAYLVYEIMNVVAASNSGFPLVGINENPAKKQKEVLFDGMFKQEDSHYPRSILVDSEDGVLRCARCQWELENPYHCDHCGFQISDDQDSGREWFWDGENAESDSSLNGDNTRGGNISTNRAFNNMGHAPITAVPQDWLRFDEGEEFVGSDLESDFSGPGEYDVDDGFIDNRATSQLSPVESDDDFVAPVNGSNGNGITALDSTDSEEIDIMNGFDEERDSGGTNMVSRSETCYNDGQRYDELRRELADLQNESLDSLNSSSNNSPSHNNIHSRQHPFSSDEDEGNIVTNGTGLRSSQSSSQNRGFDLEPYSEVFTASYPRRQARRTRTIQLDSDEES
ncbi:Ubiquitin-protein ligase E3 [Schizosaccharomyces pombe]